MATHCHNTPDSPSQTLSQQQWDELHDFIELAKDALGNGPEDFNAAFFDNCQVNLSSAMTILHNRRCQSRPWGEPSDEKRAFIAHVAEAKRIIRSFAGVIDAQAPAGQFGIPSLALDMACAELEGALRTAAA